MKNENNNLNQKDSFEDENLNIDKISQLKNSFNNDKFVPNCFDDDLNLSNIVNTNNNIEEIQDKNLNMMNNIQNMSIDKSLSEDIENFSKLNSEQNIQKDKIDLQENEKINIHIEKQNINNNKDNYKRVRTKDDLDNTPLPIFACLYCTNEKIVFNHFINEILSDKYLLLTSNYDINDLNKLISNRRLILKKDEKNDRLLNIIIKSTEYMHSFIPYEKSLDYFKSDKFIELCSYNNNNCQKIFKQKVEDSIVRKKKDFYFRGINKIPKNSLNNKCLFNSTNSLINNFNALSGLVEPVQQINVNNNVIIKNNYTFGTCSNNSINFNSLSLNNNEFNYYKENNMNNNNLDYIVEKIEKNEESVNYVDDKDLIIDIFKFDLSRKISKKDIKFDNKIYDIWNPDISSDFDDEDDDNQIYITKENKSLKITNKSILIDKNIATNKSIGYFKYDQNGNKKKTQISYNFSKMNDCSGEIKKKKNNKITKGTKSFNSNNNISKKVGFVSTYKTKKTENIKNNSKNKINKSYELNKYINNYINLNNQKYLMPSMKNIGNSTTNLSYNTNKSVNFLGKSFKKFYKKEVDKRNINSTKSLKFIKNDNSNTSTNYSISVNMNLKTNSLIKSNGLIHCINNHQKTAGINFDKPEITKDNIKMNKSMMKKDGGINMFNSINLLNLAKKRAKSSYKKTCIKNKDKYKNKNKKNDYSINKSNKKIILRKNDLYYSSNSLVNIYNTNHNVNKNFGKSFGISFGSKDYNMSDSTTNMIFNSLSNINNSNYSPYRANKTYYYNNNNNSQELKSRINNLLSLVQVKGSISNKNCHYDFNGSNLNLFKNKSINCFNSTSYIGKSKNKISKNIRPHISKF